MGLPSQDPVAPSVMARNIHRLAPLQRYAAQCHAQFLPVPEESLLRWQKIISSLTRGSKTWLKDYFNWAHLAENLGLHELVDWASVYAAGQKMLSFDASPMDKHSAECMAIAAAFCAAGCLSGPRLSPKAIARANQWLTVLTEMAACVPNDSWEDGVFLLVQLVLTKTTLMALGQFDRLATDTRHFFAAISRNGLFLLLLHNLDYTMLLPDKTEAFAIVAKCWTYVKLVETEALVLQAETLFQYEHPSLRDTIQPDRALVKWLYGLEPETPLPAYLVYDIGLLASSLFFRRFEGCTTPREISYAYLTLYSEFCAMAVPAADPLFHSIDTAVNSPKPTADVSAILRNHGQQLGAMLKVSFICVRWLLIIRAEPNKFVTLRFAHYVTTLISMFNPIMAIAETGAVLPQSLVVSLQSCSQLNTVLDMYNMLAVQALFVAVMANFIKAPTSHWGLDLRLLVNTVTASYTRARGLLENLQPYATLPLATALLKTSELLMLDAQVNTFEPEEGEVPAKQFFTHIKSKVDKSTWNTFVQLLFGMDLTASNYIEQLWRFGDVAKLHQEKPIFITKTLVLSTAFLREFEHSYRGFWFSKQHVEQYLEL